jgi:hypothetical protein
MISIGFSVVGLGIVFIFVVTPSWFILQTFCRHQSTKN